MNAVYSRIISLVVSWHAICHLPQLWICMARSIPMDQAPCAGEFVRLPMGLSQTCTLPLMWASLYFAPLFPLGKKLAALLCLQTHSLSVSFELPVADLTYVPLPLLLCHCTCRKRWHIANSRGGNLCLDATDDRCCAHNPMLTTFCQYSILGFKYIVLLGT